MKDRSPRVGRGSVLVVVIALLSCAPPVNGGGPETGAQDDGEEPTLSFVTSGADIAERANVKPSRTVLIKIIRNSDAPCTLDVGPLGVGACHTSTLGCNSYVEWKWIGSDKDYDRIEIDQKSTSVLEDCFLVGEFPLTGSGDTLKAPLQPGSDCMDPGKVWSYKVTAIHEEDVSKNCWLDPGVIIDP